MSNCFVYTSAPYYSNCFIEAIKRKLKHWRSVKLYYCKPRFFKGRFQMCHLMWSDGFNDFDFSDDETDNLPWYKCFLFKGRVRMFDHGFAAKYRDYRKRK